MIQDTQNTESKKPQNNKMEQPGEARQLELVLLGDDSSNDAPERHTEHVSNAQPLQTMAARPRLRFGRSAWGAVGLAVLLSGVAIAGMRQGTLFPASSNAALATQTNAAQANAIEVDAIELESTDSFTVARRYAGEIVAGRTSELGFERSGELVWLGVDRGDRIEAGQVLARLDTRQLQAQRSQLIAQWDQAQALLRELEVGPRTEAIEAARSRVQDLDDQLQLARIQQTRREYLYDEGAISRDQLDEVAFGADALQDRMATAQSQLDELLAGTRVEQVEAQQSVVRQLTARIDDIDIAIEKGSLIAPFSGIISARRIDEGTVVDGGQSVLRLMEETRPEIEVGIPVDAIADVRVGSAQQVTIGGRPYQSTVLAILPEVDEVTRTQQVVLTVDSADQSRLSPGQIAELAIAQPHSEEGYWVPTSALVPGDRGLWACYVIVEADRATDAPEASISDTIPLEATASDGLYQVQRQDIEVLHTNGDQSFVRGMVQPGDRVVADGTQRLVPGQLVRLSNS